MSSRIAVLASGAGSNLQALLSHLTLAGETAAGAVALVASDRGTAGALGVAASRGLATHTFRDSQDAAELVAVLRDHAITLVVLAGYLKRIPDAVTKDFRGRILNVHPALLPAFGGRGMYGHRVHEAVIASGVRISGATVHFVDDEYDHGPIVAQWPVPVRADDTPHTLAERVLHVEHYLYPRAVAAAAAGRIRLDAENRVRGELSASTPPAHSAFILSAEVEHPPCDP